MTLTDRDHSLGNVLGKVICTYYQRMCSVRGSPAVFLLHLSPPHSVSVLIGRILPEPADMRVAGGEEAFARCPSEKEMFSVDSMIT